MASYNNPPNGGWQPQKSYEVEPAPQGSQQPFSGGYGQPGGQYAGGGHFDQTGKWIPAGEGAGYGGWGTGMQKDFSWKGRGKPPRLGNNAQGNWQKKFDYMEQGPDGLWYDTRHGSYLEQMGGGSGGGGGGGRRTIRNKPYGGSRQYAGPNSAQKNRHNNPYLGKTPNNPGW